MRLGLVTEPASRQSGLLDRFGPLRHESTHLAEAPLHLGDLGGEVGRLIPEGIGGFSLPLTRLGESPQDDHLLGDELSRGHQSASVARDRHRLAFDGLVGTEGLPTHASSD